jgi:hypothetical protein
LNVSGLTHSDSDSLNNLLDIKSLRDYHIKDYPTIHKKATVKTIAPYSTNGKLTSKMKSQVKGDSKYVDFLGNSLKKLDQRL